MDELGASFIALHGWSKYRPQQGERLGARYCDLERSKREYLWKFSLHPGLWDMGALVDIIDVLLRNPDLKEHTCWKFERRSGAADFDLPARWQDKAFRIRGAAMSAQPAGRLREKPQNLELFAFDVLRFFIRILAGQGARDRFDARYLGLYHYYDGPYPIFWSGLIKKGRLNPDLLFYLRWRGRRGELDALQNHFKAFAASLEPGGGVATPGKM
jgi:hypothetical protein